jgi:fatty-acyl-CoA synthase
MQTLGDFLDALASAHRDRLAVADDRETLSFAALDAAADRWAVHLARAGVSPGQHVALLAANSPAWLATAFAVWRLGATLVPISTFVTPRELWEILAHADADVLVAQPRLRGHDYLEMVERLPALPRLRNVIAIDGRARQSRGRSGAVAEESRVIAARDAVRPTGSPESIACILYTSGTTGRPKGVQLSHRAILATVQPTAERSGLGRDDALLSTLPLFWVAGLVIRALPTLAAGCALIFVETFTPEAAIAALRRRRTTALHLRPPQVGQLLAHPDFTPDLLAAVRRGNGRTEWFGDALPAEARFITGYGMTEMAGYVTALHWDDSAEERRSGFGRPLPGVEIRIVTDDGEPCTAGDTGAIGVRGPGLFSGYYREPADMGLDAGGWFVTGDLGNLDREGRLHFIGRTKDLLRVKGINVSPLEVEQVLGTHANVEAVYVVGLPPDGLDQRLVALVVPRDTGASPAGVRHELQALALEALSSYKRPDDIVLIDRHEVLLGGTSKPQRAALATLAARRLRE